jgi:excisionase family DNA binding protein
MSSTPTRASSLVVIDRDELVAIVREAVREELTQAPMVESQYLDADRLATLLGVARSSIPQLVKREGLPTIRLGRLYRFRRSEVIAWLEERASRSGTHATKHVSSLARLRAGA